MCLRGIDTPVSGMPGLKMSVYIRVYSRALSLHAITRQAPHEAHQTLTLDLKIGRAQAQMPALGTPLQVLI